MSLQIHRTIGAIWNKVLIGFPAVSKNIIHKKNRYRLLSTNRSYGYEAIKVYRRFCTSLKLCGSTERALHIFILNMRYRSVSRIQD